MKKYLVVFAVFFCGCATMLSGTSKKIAFNLDPPEAICEYRGQEARDGEQLLIKKDAFNQITLKCSAPGYRDREIFLDKKVDVIWGIGGNLLCTSGFGLIIDAITGALMDIEESQVTVKLKKVQP